jgi:hypothetical protein
MAVQTDPTDLIAFLINAARRTSVSEDLGWGLHALCLTHSRAVVLVM